MTDFPAPFLLLPAYKDYLWGGNRLASLFGKMGGPERIAESWELSAHPTGNR
jgi:mannose-6-phosphate isomerase